MAVWVWWNTTECRIPCSWFSKPPSASYPPELLLRHLESASPSLLQSLRWVAAEETPWALGLKSKKPKNCSFLTPNYLQTLPWPSSWPATFHSWMLHGLLVSALALQPVKPSLGARPPSSWGNNPPSDNREISPPCRPATCLWKVGQPFSRPCPSYQSSGVFCPFWYVSSSAGPQLVIPGKCPQFSCISNLALEEVQERPAYSAGIFSTTFWI